MKKIEIAKEIRDTFKNIDDTYFKNEYEYRFFDKMSLLDNEDVKKYKKNELLDVLNQLKEISKRELSDVIEIFGYFGRRNKRFVSKVIAITQEQKNFFEKLLKKLKETNDFKYRLLIEKIANKFGLHRVNQQNMPSISIRKNYIDYQDKYNKKNIEILKKFLKEIDEEALEIKH